MSVSAVPAPLAQIPNALTVLRLALIPVFVAVLIPADGGRSWPAAILFGVAGVSDQLDGWLARRWRVESAFGKIADPLADRLMIDAAVLLLIHAGRLPWIAALITLRDLVLLAGTPIVLGRGYEFQVNLVGKVATWLLYASLGFAMVTHKGADWPLWIFWAGFALALVLARDALLIGGYKLVVPRGYELSVNFLGKVATWVLYAALAFVMVTHKGTDWPLWIFWTGLGLALAAGALYVYSALRTVRS